MGRCFQIISTKVPNDTCVFSIFEVSNGVTNQKGLWWRDLKSWQAHHEVRKKGFYSGKNIRVLICCNYEFEARSYEEQVIKFILYSHAKYRIHLSWASLLSLVPLLTWLYLHHLEILWFYEQPRSNQIWTNLEGIEATLRRLNYCYTGALFHLVNKYLNIIQLIPPSTPLCQSYSASQLWVTAWIETKNR